jgi:hypothetical protein
MYIFMEGGAMNEPNDKMKEIVSILMESELYFDFTIEERKQIIARLLARMSRA